MNTEDRDQIVDRLLDSALARYSEVQPRSGLDCRILANLAAHRIKRASVWNRLFWVPVACAALLAIVAGVSLLHSAKPPLNVPVVRTASVAQVQPQMPRVPAAQARATERFSRPRNRQSRAVTARVEVPRQTHFPANTAPTEQELLLMAYLNATPAHELAAVANDQQQWREEVRKKAEDRAQEPAPERDINRLHNSPLEGGNTELSAPSAR